jgi:hypothetical protein
VPAGNYHLRITVTARFGLGGESCLLRVARGNELPGRGETENVLATYNMNKTDYSGTYNVCSFSLSQPEKLTIGWVLNLPENEGSHAFRVTSIRLIDANGNDISSNYLGNYENIQRRDRSYVRFGQPTYWQVNNFYIPNGGDGTKQGIDRYPGYDCLMLGVWDDSNRATGNLANANIYRQVTLPAGHYYFCSSYEAAYNIKDAYIFAATEPLTTKQTPSKALAFCALAGTPTDNNFYGVSFILEQETSVYLGWNMDLTTASQQEFRVKALRLFRDTTYNPDGIKLIESHSDLRPSSKIYDLSGRQVNSSSLTSGIYIVGGKKVVVGRDSYNNVYR